MNIPDYLIGGDLFTGVVTIKSADGLDTDKDGKPKKSAAFHGLLPFKYTVKYLRGQEVEKDPTTGKPFKYPVFSKQKVKVWAESEPKVAAGDFARVVKPMVGAVEGNVFVQALGLEKFEPKKEA